MRTDRTELAFNLLATAYFAFLALDYYVLRLDWMLLGVVRELLTLPLILAVAAGFALSVVRLLSNWQSVNAPRSRRRADPVALNCFDWGSFVF